MGTEDSKRKGRSLVANQIATGLDRMWESGFTASLMMLSMRIRDDEKTTAATTRIQEYIQDLIRSLDED